MLALLVAELLVLSSASAQGAVPPPLPAGLAAAGPHVPYADKLALFGRFVGSWTFRLRAYDVSGKITDSSGEWHFGWILEGRAVQDVWRVPAAAAGSGTISGFGTTVRFYDPAVDAWRVTWHGVITGAVIHFLARQVGSEIVMVSQDPSELTHWIFSEITPTSFKWRNVSSSDAGKTWRTNQEMTVVRTLHRFDE